MQLALTGATGFIGGHFISAAVRHGYEIIAFSRDAGRIVPGCIATRRFALGEPPDFSGCAAIIHLAGENVAGLWTRRKMQRVRDSRILGTRRVAEAIRAMDPPPEVLISASAAGFYGDGGDSEITESFPGGTGFLGQTCRDWEGETAGLPCRVVLPRIGLVLGSGGGALPLMARAFRCCLGAQLGDGNQWMPWIHAADLARLLLFALGNLDIRGPLNAVAPWPVQNAAFTRALASAVRRPAPWRIPAFVLRMMFGKFARELLDSKRIVPATATAHGFGFLFPELGPALKDTLA